MPVTSDEQIREWLNAQGLGLVPVEGVANGGPLQRWAIAEITVERLRKQVAEARRIIRQFIDEHHSPGDSDGKVMEAFEFLDETEPDDAE